MSLGRRSIGRIWSGIIMAFVAVSLAGCATLTAVENSARSVDEKVASALTFDLGPDNPRYQVWYGDFSVVTQPSVAVIRNQRRWRDAWNLTDAYYRPPVGFNREAHTAIALFSGPLPSTGRQISIERVQIRGDRLVVEAGAIEPQNNPALRGAIYGSSPYAIIQVAADVRRVDVFFPQAARRYDIASGDTAVAAGFANAEGEQLGPTRTGSYRPVSNQLQDDERPLPPAEFVFEGGSGDSVDFGEAVDEGDAEVVNGQVGTPTDPFGDAQRVLQERREQNRAQEQENGGNDEDAGPRQLQPDDDDLEVAP